MALSHILDSVEPLAALRRRGRLIFGVSLAVDLVLLLTLPNYSGGPYRSPLAAAIAVLAVLVGIAAGPWVAVSVALFAGALHLKLDVPAGEENYVAAGLISVGLWAFAGALSGIIADQYRRRLFEREHSLARAVLSERSALERAERLLEAERAANDLETGLDEVNQLLHSTLEFEQIMQQALHEGMQHLGLDGGIVEIREDEGWTIRYQYGAEPLQAGMRLTAREAPVAARAVRTKTLVVIDEVADDDRGMDTGFWRVLGARSVLAAPLIVRDDVVGCLVFYNQSPRRYTDTELEFVRDFAASVSLAFENARLYETQRSLAMGLQEHFLHPMPVAPGLRFGLVSRAAYEPALVGGDFFDVFELDANRVAVLIGDVSGKGIEAAGLTETVRSTVRAFALLDARPDVILNRANEVLIKRGEQLHATAYLLVLDTRTGEAWHSTAGHPPPVRCGGRDVKLVEDHFGPPLGTFALPHEAMRVVLEPQDSLVFYTDGVTEARRDRKLFGEHRLLEAVSRAPHDDPQALADAVSAAVDAYADVLQDDIQIVVLQFAGREDVGAEEETRTARLQAESGRSSARGGRSRPSGGR